MSKDLRGLLAKLCSGMGAAENRARRRVESGWRCFAFPVLELNRAIASCALRHAPIRCRANRDGQRGTTSHDGVERSRSETTRRLLSPLQASMCFGIHDPGRRRCAHCSGLVSFAPSGLRLLSFPPGLIGGGGSWSFVGEQVPEFRKLRVALQDFEVAQWKQAVVGLVVEFILLAQALHMEDAFAGG